MESCRPPDVPVREFRDEDGEVIRYGARWGMASPPDEAYSVTTHPERFAPLAEVGRGLIAYLERTNDVTVTEDLALATEGGSNAGWSLPSPGEKAQMRDIRASITSRNGKPWAAWRPRNA
jgi:hypothetical protein